MSQSHAEGAAPRVVRVLHPCLDAGPGAVPVSAARLTDQQRIAVLLQAAGLLSLLDRAGWAVPDWTAASATPDGRLTLPEGAAPGRSGRHAQEVLRDLLGRLFRFEGSAAFAGRGAARRAARLLLDRWFQDLTPLSPDDAVAQILGDAPFLWEPAFAAARAALAGELGDGDELRFWIAGPRPFRLRLLSRCRSAMELRDRLAGPEARAAWEGEETADAIELASLLDAKGRTDAALEALEGLRTPGAETVRARCQLHLGLLGAVRATLRRLEKIPLTPDQAVELAEVAARVLANAGEANRAEAWIRRALRIAGRQGRAGLVAAAAAWDRCDLDSMDHWLEVTRPVLNDPDLAWRWHHVRGLRAEREPDQGSEAVAHVSRAIRLGRRRLSRHEAAGLWNDLGLGRARLGDLAGAERAYLHVTRLLEACDGPRKITLALPNLAEIRLRRGRLVGVREILDRTTAENRAAGNVRGLAQDTALRARYELVLGRPEAALELCREAMALGADQEVPRLLAARALGWLRRPQEAAAELTAVRPGTLEELEPEERPAVRALAGDAEGALGEAEGTPFEPLWRAALAGEPCPWIDPELEPFRAARLVFDLDLIAPGCIPSPALRSAAAVFRRLGAPGPAGRLEARDQGPWQALANYLEKPIGNTEALTTLFDEVGVSEEELSRRGDAQARALIALVAREREPRPGMPLREPERAPAAGGEMVGESPAFQDALERIARLAPGDVPILILGESGTGKELAARRIHRMSSRARASFLPVNCAATSETLILSDLFGHARGAFTGADKSRQGFFETADGGTLFLDEIGDLPLSAQGMLLRALQEGEVRPLGETRSRKVNVRVLAATHRDLSAMVMEKTFRQDLYYRLRVGSVLLPPLRDRGEDVLLLAERLLPRLGNGRAPRLSREARALLLGYGWPGNIRELQNVLSVAAALAGEGVIEPWHLELPETKPAVEGFYHQRLDALRREMLLDAIAKHGHNQARIARYLGISRQGVSHLFKQFKIA